MKKKKKIKGKRYSGYRLHNPSLWKPGEPLTKKDEELLSTLVRIYQQCGYVPAMKGVPNAAAIKMRFRTWKDALAAAGLPSMNDPEQQRRRQQKIQEERRVSTNCG